MLNEKEIKGQMMAHLKKSLLPFWRRALDHQHGGVFTCFTNDGTKRSSSDKYTWSQGRFLWIESRLCRWMQRGLLEEDRLLRNHAEKTYQFLSKHATLENGHCAFLLSRNGKKKEEFRGKGWDTSIYADCFVALGYTEYAALTETPAICQQAIDLYHSVQQRIKAGTVKSDPYPVPKGFSSHSFYMILLNVVQELAATAKALGHPETLHLHEDSIGYMNHIMETFRLPNGRVVEMLPMEAEMDKSMLSRHVNPGHALESMWFILHTAKNCNDQETIKRAVTSILYALELGWDSKYGGVLRFVDYLGGQPSGSLMESPYETLIQETWDTKLWWTHSEALYASLIGYKTTGCSQAAHWFQRLNTYIFEVFPNRDESVGEWIQIRDRQGTPSNKLVALPVKDPFHILRNLILIIELLTDSNRCYF